LAVNVTGMGSGRLVAFTLNRMVCTFPCRLFWGRTRLGFDRTRPLVLVWGRKSSFCSLRP